MSNIKRKDWSPKDKSKLKKEVFAREAQRYYERDGGKEDRNWGGFEERAEEVFKKELKK